MKKLFILINVLLLCAMTFAQKESPTIIGITEVSDNYYLISWSSPAGAISYVLHYYDFAQKKYIPVQEEINEPLKQIYIPKDTVYFFALEAKYSSTEISGENLKRKPWVDAPSNILLKGAFDSCSNNLTLSWNRFYYPSPSGKRYLMYCNGKTLDKMYYDTIGGIDTAIVIKYADLIKKLEDNKAEFQLNVYTGTDRSTSNTYYFEMPAIKRGPAFIEATGTSATALPATFTKEELQKSWESRKINLEFKVDPQSELDRFILFRSKKNEIEGFEKVEGLVLEGLNITHEDESVDSLDNKQFFYKIQVLNSCGQPGVESNVESNIPLIVIKAENNSINTLQWGDYKKFKGNIKEYNVYRVRAGKGIKSIGSFHTTLAVDNLGSLEEKDVEELVCYYVEAVEENNPNGVNGKSISNLACTYLSANIKMPQSLILGPSCTPATNPDFYFKPSQDVMSPKSFKMIITDRWGSKVFETDDISDGWNGSYQNTGPVVPQGGYMYYYKFVSKTGQIEERRGSFIVICP